MPPNTPARTARRHPATPSSSHDDVKNRLLQSALEILYSEGLQALTQSRVAKATGVRQSHLTYYFPTRNQLLSSVVELGMQDAACHLGPEEPSLPPTLEDYVQVMTEQICDTRLPRLMMSLTLATEEDPTLKRWMIDFRTRVVARMREAFTHYGIDTTEQQVELFHTLLVGLVVTNLAESSPESALRTGNLLKESVRQLITRTFALPGQT